MKRLGRVPSINDDKKPHVDDKWTDSIASQASSLNVVRAINTKTLPLEDILFDGNSRELRITPDEIRNNLETLRLPPRALEYEAVAASVFDDPMKLADFMSIAMFAASLKAADRLLNPIVVWREGVQFYKITGERRYLAHVLLGEPAIAARIYETRPSDFEIAVIRWEENYQRENLCLHDELKSLEELVSGWKIETNKNAITVTQFQNISGMSRAKGGRYLKVLTDATPKLWAAMRQRQVIALGTAYELAALGPEECDRKLIQLLKGGGETARDLQRQRAATGKRTRRTKPTKMGRVPNVLNPTFIRRARKQDVKAVKLIVYMLRDGLKSKDLTEELDKLDLDTAKGVGQAMEKIMASARHLAGEK